MNLLLACIAHFKRRRAYVEQPSELLAGHIYPTHIQPERVSVCVTADVAYPL